MSAVQTSSPAFFPVSTTKLVAMSICTFGLYQIYWFYRNWRFVKRRERSNISPPWRSVFGIFFCYPLFRRIEATAKTSGLHAPPAAIAAAWALVALLAYLPEPYLFLSFGAVLFLVPAQMAANVINANVAPGHDRNDRFGALNIAALGIGGLFVVLSIIGLLIGPQQA